MEYRSKKTLAYCIPLCADGLLLKKNKWGIGEGRWTGFSAKISENEKASDAAKRVVEETTGIKLFEMTALGKLIFEFEGDPELLETFIYSGKALNKYCTQSKEIVPQWFEFSSLPLGEMWPDAMYWLPLAIKKQQFEGFFYFKDT